MFAGTLGRSQFFLRSSLLGLAETAVLLACIAIQHEAFIGPPGEGRYHLAVTAFLVSAFFGYKRVSFAIRRNRDAGGGEVLAGIYTICTCMAIVLQVQALVVRTNDSPMNGLEYASLLYLLLGGIWLYLLFAAAAPAEARNHAEAPSFPDGSGSSAAPAAHSQLSLAMEQAIAGKKPIPAGPLPTRTQGFLESVQRAPVPRQRTEFGRRGAK